MLLLEADSQLQFRNMLKMVWRVTPSMPHASLHPLDEMVSEREASSTVRVVCVAGTL